MRVMAGIFLLKHSGGFASRHVNSFVRGIEPHIVVQRRTGEGSHNFSGVGVEHKEFGWLSRGAKYTMICFVKNKGIRGASSRSGPPRYNFAGTPIDYTNL